MKVGTELDRKGVMGVLPHRDPFLFIDQVEQIKAGTHEDQDGDQQMIGRTIVAYSAIRPEQDFFKGHFPERPIMPGVLQLETMAQAAAILAYDPALHGEKLEVLLVQAQDVRFRRMVVPGDRLRIEATLTDIKRNRFFHFDCACTVEDQKASSARLVASFGRKM